VLVLGQGALQPRMLRHLLIQTLVAQVLAQHQAVAGSKHKFRVRGTGLVQVPADAIKGGGLSHGRTIIFRRQDSDEGFAVSGPHT
jgi:hypothetical protein